MSGPFTEIPEEWSGFDLASQPSRTVIISDPRIVNYDSEFWKRFSAASESVEVDLNTPTFARTKPQLPEPFIPQYSEEELKQREGEKFLRSLNWKPSIRP